MLQGDLSAAAIWALRLAIASAMIVVDDPFRLAAAGMLLALQIPVHAVIAAYAQVRSAPRA